MGPLAVNRTRLIGLFHVRSSSFRDEMVLTILPVSEKYFKNPIFLLHFSGQICIIIIPSHGGEGKNGDFHFRAVLLISCEYFLVGLVRSQERKQESNLRDKGPVDKPFLLFLENDPNPLYFRTLSHRSEMWISLWINAVPHFKTLRRPAPRRGLLSQGFC